MTTKFHVSPALAIFIAATSCPGVLLAAEPDRLLPTAKAAEVSVAVSTDGRAINLTLTNESSFVVTAGKVRCLQPIPKSNVKPDECLPDPPVVYWELAGKKGPKPVESAECQKWRADPYTRSPEVALFMEFQKTVKPGGTASLYGEMPAATVVASCALSDLRGHERTWRDIF